MQLWFPQHGQFSVPMRHKFPKAEHICLKRDIDQLFTAGTRSAVSFPLRAIVRTRPHDGKFPRVQVLISVAKRRLRHAVDRNRAKRQIREAYRGNNCLRVWRFIWDLCGWLINHKIVHWCRSVSSVCCTEWWKRLCLLLRTKMRKFQ